MIILPGPDKNYTPEINLKLVTALEGVHGSLYQVAETLLDKSLPLSEMVDILRVLYRHAGCEMEDAALGDYILRQPCTELLITALLDILGPVERSGPSAEFLSEMLAKFPDKEG